LDFLAKSGNKNALSDVVVAAMLARTALLGALSNVEINLCGLSECVYKSDLIKRVGELRQSAYAREKSVLDAITLY
jgi:formiminotetrahydrofolate cyclodeaminase